MGKLLINGCFLQHAPTGVQRYSWEVSRRIMERDSQALYVIPSSLSVSAHYEGIAEKRIWRFRDGRAKIWEQISLPLAVKSDDVLWTPAGLGPFYGVRRHLLTIHDISVLERPEWFSRSYAGYYRVLMPLAIRRAAAVTTVSQYSASRVARYRRDSSAASVALLAVNSSFTHLHSEEDSAIRAAYALPYRYVLAVGSLEPRKNLHRLIQAMADIQRLDSELTLVLVGEKRDIYGRASLKPEEQQKVLFTGYVASKDLPAIYRGAEIFAYPSLYEGFGLPPLEAMACGTPTLTSSVTSLPEVVGDAAICVDPTDTKAITAGLRSLLETPALREDLRARGIIRAATFSWSRTADIVYGEYTKLAAERA